MAYGGLSQWPRNSSAGPERSCLRVLKDMIVTGGENVYSGEVKAVLYEHPAVREAAVFGMPGPPVG